VEELGAVTRLTVAVVIPTIPGREMLLEQARQSALRQERKPDQIVVERDSERTGAWAARNRGLARVHTDVVAWLDDDDALQPNHLKACMRVLENSAFRPDLVYPAPVMIGGADPTAVTHQSVFPVSPWGLRFTQEHAEHIRQVGSFIPMTHLVRTEAVRAIGGFRPGYTLPSGRYRGEDEDYLIRLLDRAEDQGRRVQDVFEHARRSNGRPLRTWYWNVHREHTAGRGV
jgi:glycosyltransferase involved in cell wall biosynthesis